MAQTIVPRRVYIGDMNGYPVEMLDEYLRLQEATNDHQIRFVIELGGRPSSCPSPPSRTA